MIRLSATGQIPASTTGRIEFLDTLRGIALFGILLVNLYSFGADSIAWTHPADRVAWHLKYVLFESKFWSLYALLFGASFYLLTQSTRYTTLGLIRRYFFLFLIGCLHALFFEGDILMLYAELSFFLLLLYRLPRKILICLAGALWLSFPISHFLVGDRGDDWPAATAEEAREWLTEDRAEHLYSTGTLKEVVAEHAQYLPERFWIDYQYPDSGFVVLGVILIGIVLARSSPWRDHVGRVNNVQKYCALFWVLGIALMTFELFLSRSMGYSAFERSESPILIILLGDIVYLVATLSLTGAWTISVWLWVAKQPPSILRKCVCAAGQMSLTLYLMQTAVFSMVFYGFGLNQAFLLDPTGVTTVALIIYAAQLVFARIWLSRYTHGPVEWLWRIGTHLEIKPLKKTLSPRHP